MVAPAGIPFGQYVLGKRLARGGMAEVFLARQRGVEGFDRRVAVKRILPHLADSAEFIKMFLAEARYAARLAHPNIVHIYELGQNDDSYFIAMEFVDGVHSGQLIKHAAAEPIPPVLVARIGADAAGALAYAHRQEDADGRPLGLVHRDVSPQNIMISFDGVVKLVDFGIAKAASKAEETQPGIVKGKYAYMSPEQTTRKPLDGRSDVFSLGVVMWELLSGRNIVDRGDVVEAMKIMRDCRFPRVEQVAPHVPAALARAVGWALTRHRDDRPTAAQLQAALEEIIKESPVLATPLQLGEWIRPRFPRLVSTAALPALDDSGEAGAGRGARRTGPPPAGTQVVQFTGEGPAATRVVAVTDAASALATPGRLAALGVVTPTAPTAASPATGGAVAAAPALPGVALPLPPPRPPRPSPPPRPPTDEDELTIIAPGLDGDGLLGEGTTRVADPALAADARRRVALIVGGLAVTAVLAGLVASGVLSGSRTELGAGPTGAARDDADAGPRAPLPVDAATPLAPELGAADADADTAAVAVAPPDAARGGVADAAAPALVASPDAAPAPALATLEVVTRPPGARVVVDGAPAGTSPVVLRDRRPGKVALVVQKDGHAPLARAVDLAAGQHRTVELVLEKKGGAAAPRGGFLTARTQPYSVVYLGGRRLGETPFAAVPLPAGRHVLVFKHPGRPPVTRTVTIRAGETTKLAFEL
ncbi:MAG: protein kinase [Myxococcales bacterium]|nr:protein kinase [Myxococcales bacterium]